MWVQGARFLHRRAQLWDQPRRYIKLNRSALEADSSPVPPPLSATDQEAEYMDTLMREYPALASRGRIIAAGKKFKKYFPTVSTGPHALRMRDQISDQITTPWTSMRSFSFFLRPVAALGRQMYVKMFLLTPLNALIR